MDNKKNEFDFLADSGSPKSIQKPNYSAKKKLAVPIWAWILGGVLIVGLIGSLVKPPKNKTNVSEKSSWDKAWDSLPQKNGKPDLENASAEDIRLAEKIDIEAGMKIRELWNDRRRQKTNKAAVKTELNKKRFQLSQYEMLLACDESYVEAILGVSGVESASSGNLKTVTYKDDFGSIISITYQREKNISGDMQWRLKAKSQIGL